MTGSAHDKLRFLVNETLSSAIAAHEAGAGNMPAANPTVSLGLIAGMLRGRRTDDPPYRIDQDLYGRFLGHARLFSDPSTTPQARTAQAAELIQDCREILEQLPAEPPKPPPETVISRLQERKDIFG